MVRDRSTVREKPTAESCAKSRYASLDLEDEKALELVLKFESSYVYLLSGEKSSCRAWYDLRPGFVTSSGASNLARLSSTMRSEYTDLRSPDTAFFILVSGQYLDDGDAAVAL
jgi:hypothetical protein